ncbi:MAG: hypothetical protein RI601_12925 [Desulfurivibrionaceae bacterium]|nr:hypothetical protein [Desulfurivibrionaceae bacterium]
MKIALNYDERTGNVTDNKGSLILRWMGLEEFEIQEKQDGKEIIQLVSLGVSPDDLIKLKENGLL